MTIELAKLSVESKEATKKFSDFHVVDANAEIDFGDVKVSFFRTTHSVPGSMGIVLDTDEGEIVYTGT